MKYVRVSLLGCIQKGILLQVFLLCCGIWIKQTKYINVWKIKPLAKICFPVNLKNYLYLPLWFNLFYIREISANNLASFIRNAYFVAWLFYFFFFFFPPLSPSECQTLVPLKHKIVICYVGVCLEKNSFKRMV